MKLSKGSKQRIKRLSMADKKALKKAATMLADVEAITNDRYVAICRAINSTQGVY